MRPLIRGAALFAIGCALWLLVVDRGEPAGESILAGVELEHRATAFERALGGLETAQRVRRAIGAENYGVAADEVAWLERQLTELLAELSPQPDHERNDGL